MWYFASDGEKRGPVSQQELRSLLIKGRISTDCPVWHDAMSDWQPIDTVDEFIAVAELLKATNTNTDEDYKPTRPTEEGATLGGMVMGVILFFIRIFSGHILLFVISMALVAFGWMASVFINDYDVKDHQNVEVVGLTPKRLSPLNIKHNKQHAIWADGIDYETKAFEIGSRLIKANNIDDHIKFSISYSKDERFIAYSIPAQRMIVITNQILSLVNSDDELAAIIGHEMAHIEYNHNSFSHKMLETGDEREAYHTKEFEADVLGATMAANAGYNPVGAINIFNAIETGTTTPKIDLDFSKTMIDHPPTTDRVRVLTYLIQQKYPEYIGQPYPSQWSLADTVNTQGEAFLALKADIDKQKSTIDYYKHRLNNINNYANEAAYTKELNAHNRLVDPYNADLAEANRLAEDVNTLLAKYNNE